MCRPCLLFCYHSRGNDNIIIPPIFILVNIIVTEHSNNINIITIFYAGKHFVRQVYFISSKSKPSVNRAIGV